MTEYVTDSIRDSIMEIVLSLPENHMCFDCGNKNPLWASAYLGILICFECAARHRSYGTHISFIRSVNLDKWNRKQLKSLEITGNKYVRERFSDFGIIKVSGIYEYSSDMIQKYKAEVADKVKELLNLENYKGKANNQISNTHDHSSNDAATNNLIKPMEEINFDDVPVNKPKEENQEVQYKEPTKFTNFAENINVKVVSSTTTTTGKNKRTTNKIQKVDFDFNFENFNDVNFSSFGGNGAPAESDNNPSKNSSEPNFDEEFSSGNKKKNKYEDEDTDSSYKPKISQDEINKKFANKKAISSDDYALLEEDPSQKSSYKNKLNNMKFSQAISSSDIYGEQEDNSTGLGSKLKDMALGFTLKAAEKAKEFKDKTSNLIHRIQNKYGNN